MHNNHIERHGVTKRWSDAVVHGGVVYFVEVPDDPTTGPKEQFSQVLDQVERRLLQVRSDRTRLLQVVIYLPNPDELSLFNEVWDEWVPSGHAPSRACIHAALAAKEYRVELVITAAVSVNDEPASGR